MAITTKRVSRVFKHGATEYPDPSPSSTPEQCLAMLATGNPTFNNATASIPANAESEISPGQAERTRAPSFSQASNTG